MGLFYSATKKELLDIRNKIFLEKGIPELNKNGFIKSPFLSSWYGRNNLKDFTYNLSRLSPNSQLELVTAHIIRGEKWIQLFLNIFEIKPGLTSLDELKSIDGIQFSLPPNTISDMRLRCDDFKNIPLTNLLFHKEYKLKSFYTKKGLNNRVKELGEIIEKDMANINHFINRWHEIHRPMITNWDGTPNGPC